MGCGLWVTDLIGGAVDPVSGTYSKAAAGFWVENGEVAFPVQDVTIAGELPQMLKQIAAVGSDIHRRGAVRSGSLLIESMRVSGR
jgi:PmbA protein